MDLKEELNSITHLMEQHLSGFSDPASLDGISTQVSTQAPGPQHSQSLPSVPAVSASASASAVAGAAHGSVTPPRPDHLNHPHTPSPTRPAPHAAARGTSPARRPSPSPMRVSPSRRQPDAHDPPPAAPGTPPAANAAAAAAAAASLHARGTSPPSRRPSPAASPAKVSPNRPSPAPADTRDLPQPPPTQRSVSPGRRPPRVSDTADDAKWVQHKEEVRVQYEGLLRTNRELREAIKGVEEGRRLASERDTATREAELGNLARRKQLAQSEVDHLVHQLSLRQAEVEKVTAAAASLGDEVVNIEASLRHKDEAAAAAAAAAAAHPVAAEVADLQAQHDALEAEVRFFSLLCCSCLPPRFSLCHLFFFTLPFLPRRMRSTIKQHLTHRSAP